MLKNVQAVILAAGKSSRFKTGKTKLVEKICGQEMILYPTSLLVSLKLPVTLVVGFQKELVEKTVTKHFSQDVTFIHQTEQLGTGHAIACSQSTWNRDHILIMNGDMPLISADIIQSLYNKHIKHDAAISFVTAHNCDPSAASYGRVIKASDSIEIIEAKELKDDGAQHCCINAGIYIAKRTFLETNIPKLQKSTLSKEWYITDLVKLASDEKLNVETISSSFDTIRGINTFKELWAAEQIKKSEIIQKWMDNGVRFSTAHNVQIDVHVTIGSGTFIDSGVHILGNTKIGKHCSLAAFSIIKNSILHDNATVHSHTIITNATVESFASVGPFAHIHEKTTVQEKAVVGNFVEIKKSTVGQETKIKHLAYVGDTKLGKRVNVGAGTITCNYNGTDKFKTIIEDDVFVGSNSTLIAPVTIKKHAFVAAGSTINKDVPEDALAIARERQTNKENYARNLRHAKPSTTKDATNEEKESALPFLGAFKVDNFENNESA